MNKANGGDGIPFELFQILKDDAANVLHSICQQIWKTKHWPQDWKRSVFIPIPKKRQCQRMLKLPHSCTHLTRQRSNAQILQARFPQNVNHELPDVQAGIREGRGTINQFPNICCIILKAREFQKNIYFSFIDYAKAFDCVDHNKLWKILKEMGPAISSSVVPFSSCPQSLPASESFPMSQLFA